MSRHNRQQSKRSRRTPDNQDPQRVSLAMRRFEDTGRYPVYSTQSERVEAARRLSRGENWFALWIDSK